MTEGQHPRIGILVGSIRDERQAIHVANWVKKIADAENLDAEFALIDLKDQEIPPLTAATPPRAQKGNYADDETQAWAGVVGGFDGFIFATPEYNASIPGTMKNAFDILYVEWVEKPVGFVAWGGNGGDGAVRHWHDIVERVGMQIVTPDVLLPFRSDFTDHKIDPTEESTETLKKLLAAVVEAAAK